MSKWDEIAKKAKKIAPRLHYFPKKFACKNINTYICTRKTVNPKQYTTYKPFNNNF